MSIATLADIITKVRKLSASGNSFQLTDSQIEDYINSFYSYDLPAQFRSLKLKDKYTFNTIRGIDTYAFDSENYITVSMPCYCAKREIRLFQDPWSFYGVNFNWQNLDNFATGDGTPGPYSGSTTASPILRSTNNNPGTGLTNVNYPASRVQNVLITANIAYGQTANVTDDGSGNLIQYLDSGLSQAVGTIDYGTGAISNLNFVDGNGNALNIPSGEQIQIQYNPVVLSIPLSIMFFQNQFTLRPVPDRGYTIELIAYRKPTQALLNTANEAGTPELNEWWELLAVGAAKKIYEERLDPDGILLMDKMLKERYDVAYTRTYAQIGSQRINTLFADQLNYSYGAGMFGFGNPGP
jgi:hypothetical protein